ncbi:MAG: glycosyltransferase family 1 protein, partial [bacterium]|nr:glycosyltransferase family 1 protein [bacterium]
CGEAGMYFDPPDVKSMAETISKIFDNNALRLDLIAKGLERSELFGFEKTAERLSVLFEKVLHDSRLKT